MQTNSEAAEQKLEKVKKKLTVFLMYCKDTHEDFNIRFLANFNISNHLTGII